MGVDVGRLQQADAVWYWRLWHVLSGRRDPLGPRETVETGCGVLIVAASRLIPGSPM